MSEYSNMTKNPKLHFIIKDIFAGDPLNANRPFFNLEAQFSLYLVEIKITVNTD